LTQQNTDINNQKELAHEYCVEIDDYIKQLEPITAKREQIQTDINRLTIISAVLPIILALITGATALMIQQFWPAFINMITALPPVLTHINKNRLEKYNGCTDLKLTLTGFKGHITRLAITGELKGKDQEEIDESLLDFNDMLLAYLQINT